MKKYPLNEVEYYTRFRDMIEEWGLKYENKPAISWFTRKQEEKGVTFGQLRDDVRYLQEMLIQMGLAGKHIAIVGENCYEWLVVYFAATYCGSVAVCIDIEQLDETILQMLSMADVSAVFLSSAYTDICSKYAGQDKDMFLLSEKSGSFPTVRSLIEKGAVIWQEGKENIDIDKQVTPDATAAIVFTSGTTTLSRLCLVNRLYLPTHRMLLRMYP